MAKREDYAVVNGMVVFKETADMDVKEWLQEMCNLTGVQFSDMIHGSICSDKIVICKGHNHDSVDLNEVSAKTVLTLLVKHSAIFGMKTVFLHNGYKGNIDDLHRYCAIQTVGYGCFTEWD